MNLVNWGHFCHEIGLLLVHTIYIPKLLSLLKNNNHRVGYFLIFGDHIGYQYINIFFSKF
jgi:hypothetical protein